MITLPRRSRAHLDDGRDETSGQRRLRPPGYWFSPSTTVVLDKPSASRHPHRYSQRYALTEWDRPMHDQNLHPLADLSAADWLRPRLRRFGSAVTAVVPDGFPAYVRILHPARGAADQPVRWAEVAAWSGRRMHRRAQFHAIARPTTWMPRDPAPWDGEPPPDGNLPAELLGILCATLAEHTSTTDSCWFCLWDGYGWLYGTPRWGSWVPAAPCPSRPRSLSRSCMDPVSGSHTGTTSCSPVHWRQHPNSAGPAPVAASSRSHPTCSGPATTPGASPPRSTCTAP